nr:MAG TPA: hypothetical protein [Caudoviricetes sp.]
MFEDMFDRDLFQMSSTYRDIVPEYVFPDLNYLRDDEDDNREDDEEVEKVKTTEKRDSYRDSEEYKAFLKRIDDGWVEKVKYWTKFYRKHKVLNFMREFLFWVPREHMNVPERIRKRAEEEIRKESKRSSTKK